MPNGNDQRIERIKREIALIKRDMMRLTALKSEMDRLTAESRINLKTNDEKRKTAKEGL